MNSKSINRNVWALTLSLCLGVIFTHTTGYAAEEDMGRPGPIPCPNPLPINLTATNLGPTTANQNGQHTFQWKEPTNCCQYLRGEVKLEFKALKPGTPGNPPNTTPDANNDKWYTQGGQAGPLWPNTPAFPVGHTGSKSIPLNAADLSAMSGGTFLIKWQDDTNVTKATLQAIACCVKPK